MAAVSSSKLAATLRQDINSSASGAKRLKLRTLLAKFGYTKRSDVNTAEITEALGAVGIWINPPIMRLGDDWKLTTEDWVYLGTGIHQKQVELESKSPPALEWNADGWFDRLGLMELRTEKEVEIKFIVPLLTRLGFSDDDRYDGMPVPAAHGSRDTTLVIDFALFNSSIESLKNQPVLTVEAKRESRIAKKHELLSAHNQAKSYCLWTQCDFFMVTDSRSVQVYHIARGRMNDLNPLFACERHDLLERFGELFALISKDVLTKLYLKKLATVEEAL